MTDLQIRLFGLNPGHAGKSVVTSDIVDIVDIVDIITDGLCQRSIGKLTLTCTAKHRQGKRELSSFCAACLYHLCGF